MPGRAREFFAMMFKKGIISALIEPSVPLSAPSFDGDFESFFFLNKSENAIIVFVFVR